jgi:Ca2+-binding RTX toxin-like protein
MVFDAWTEDLCSYPDHPDMHVVECTYHDPVSGGFVARVGAFTKAGNDEVTLIDGSPTSPHPVMWGDTRITLGEGDDVVDASRVVDDESHLDGEGGDDRFVSSTSYMDIDGGAGADTIDNSSPHRAPGPVEVDLLTPDAWLDDPPVAGWSVPVGYEPPLTPDKGGSRLWSIENAVGTAWGDEIEGSGGANVLDGAGGDDVLEGLPGDDTLVGGTGADVVVGGDGAHDLVSYRGHHTGVTVDLSSPLSFQGAPGEDDVVAQVEDILGSNAADHLTGSSGKNTITGDPCRGHRCVSLYSTADVIDGGGSDDTLYGGIGADTVTGGDGADALFGDPGDDTLSGGAGYDVLDGGAGTDDCAVDAGGGSTVGCE